MSQHDTRRQFFARAAGVAAGAVFSRVSPSQAASAVGATSKPAPRVAIARDEAITRGRVDEHGELLRKLLDAGMQKVTNAPDAAAAWRGLFKPKDRVGIKVNTLGRSTHPVVVDAIVAGLRSGGVPAENIIIWDRFDVELAEAGFKLNRSSTGVQCRGTDADRNRTGKGYLREIETSGEIGSCFSRIAAEEVTAHICVPILKDHNLAGVSLGMKNFYGAIHNPNKYHDRNCDPYVVDVVSHRYIGPKWRLTVCDATRGQYHAGPTHHPGYTWPFGGLIVGRDFVAVDAVAADLLEAQRKAKGLASLADEKRPASHITTAGTRGLGEADLGKIERIEV